jgi:hypothetical protein
MEVGKAYPVLMGRIDDKDKTKKERERISGSMKRER